MKPVSLRTKIALVVTAAFAAVLVAFYLYSKNQPKEESVRAAIPGLLRAGESGFDEYQSYVKIINPKGELGVNYRGDRIAIVSGGILNQGEKNLEAVELKITLFDVYGKALKEEVRTPLRPGIGLRTALQPLESRSFTIWTEGMPLSWDPRRVDVQVNGLKFAK